MESADVTILVLDASLKVSEQDAKIASLALERGRVGRRREQVGPHVFGRRTG